MRGRRESLARYTPPLAPNTRSLRRPVEYDGSAAAPLVARRRGLFPFFDTYSLPPETNAIDLQLPDTAIAVAGCFDWRPFGDRRRGRPPEILATKASTWPFVSPRTRFEAADRKPTQLGTSWNAPS